MTVLSPTGMSCVPIRTDAGRLSLDRDAAIVAGTTLQDQMRHCCEYGSAASVPLDTAEIKETIRILVSIMTALQLVDGP
jgi:hypothetical protein